MAAPLLRAMTLGEVLDVSFGIYRSHFMPLLVVAAVTQVIPLSLSFFVPTAEAWMLHPWIFLSYVISKLLTTSIGVAATTLIVSGVYSSSPLSASDALRRALPLLGVLLLLTFATGLVLFFGFLALIIPGFILYAGLALAPAAAILEAPISATDAMGRSWALTKGQRGKIFLAIMVPVLLLLVPGITLGIILALVMSDIEILTRILESVLTVFFYPYLYVVIAVCYYDQRIRKEGFDLEILAAAAQPV